MLDSFTYSCWLCCGVFECVISFRFYMSTFRPHHSSRLLLSVHLVSGRLHITSVTMEMPFQGDTEPDFIPLVEREREKEGGISIAKFFGVNYFPFLPDSLSWWDFKNHDRIHLTLKLLSHLVIQLRDTESAYYTWTPAVSKPDYEVVEL